MNTRDQLWARVYADTLQRKSHIEAEEGANFAVRAFDRRAALANKPPAGEQKPYGRVTVVRRPGCVDQHWFYRWPEPPYLDNAAECHTVYTAPQPEQVAQDSLNDDDAEKLALAIEEFDECGETSVDYAELMRFANMGLLECRHFDVLPAAQDAIDAARARGEGERS